VITDLTGFPDAGRSYAGYTRIIGYSPSAGFVRSVITDPNDDSGVSAWKTRGADLRDYLTGKENAPSTI
jgi:hypothetical protein